MFKSKLTRNKIVFAGILGIALFLVLILAGVSFLKVRGTTPPQIRGGVVPHDTNAERLINHFWQAAASSSAQTVLIIGPRHHEHQNKLVATENFWSLENIPHDQDFLNNDHAYTIHLPYIKKILPQAQVKALLIDSRISKQTLDELTDQLAPFIDEKTLIVGSIDFSHYLTKSKMMIADQKTRECLNGNNLPNCLVGWNDDQTDSWAGLYVLTKLAQKKRATISIADYSNTVWEQNNSNLNTATSWWELQFIAAQD